MLIEEFAEDICNYLITLPQVKQCCLYGSLSNNCFDKYSDIDVEIDVSGIDNGKFIMEIPRLLSNKYNVIFYDYAPSLVPEKYVVSIAINEQNPFMIVDISCIADPHCESVLKQDLLKLNNLYDHTLKLFSANLKHYIRGEDCYIAIQKMYKKLFPLDASFCSEDEMLNKVYNWIKENAEERHMTYIKSYEKYI